jgi:ankyrin repeat protein
MSDHLNLEYLRKEAKTILKQCRAGDRASLERVRAQLPKLASKDLREIAEQIKLADVHHALAREHDCSNWGELKRHDAPLARFLSAARSGSLKSVQHELAQFPDLVEESIHAACVIGDADAVRYYLELDRRLLTAEEGGWPPLLYACSSPFHRASERHAAGLVECAGVLLDHGEDPNQSSALFRASISGNRSVAVLLYQRGATPSSNDNQKAKEAFWGIPADPRAMDQALVDLFNNPEIVEQMRKRMADKAARHSGWFGKAGPQHVSPRDVYKPAHPGNHDYNLMIWEFLIQRGIRPNWYDTSADTPLHYLAISDGGANQVKFFLENGADPNVRRADGRTPYFLAVRAGNRDVADVLRSQGADVGCVHPIDELIGACTSLDAEGARAIVRSHPDVVKTAAPADREILVGAPLQIGWIG